jgi:ribosome-binding protein aMBF1 (putative translation factor)
MTDMNGERSPAEQPDPLAGYPLDELGRLAAKFSTDNVREEAWTRATELSSAGFDHALHQAGMEVHSDAAERAFKALDDLGLSEAMLDHLLEIPTPEFVRRKRESLGISMRELGDIVGVDQSYVSRLERGLQDVPSMLKVMLKVLLDIDRTADK